MGDIKRQITSIIDLKRGSTDVNYVYRANVLVWQRSAPPVIDYNIVEYNTEYTYNSLRVNENKYSTTYTLFQK